MTGFKFGDLNHKMSLILPILIFKSNLNFMLSSVEHENLGPYVYFRKPFWSLFVICSVLSGLDIQL